MANLIWRSEQSILRDLGAPTLASVVLLGIGGGFVTGWLPQMANPVRTFHVVYCAFIAVWVLWKMPGTARYQRWFHDCGLELAKRRGLGHKGMVPFGCLQPPAVPPVHFIPVGIALATALALAAAGIAPRLCTAVAFCLYFVYYTQVFAEACAGGHGTVLVPSILFILACSPQIENGSELTSTWPLWLLKAVIASGYCASGMLKVICSIKFGAPWCDGATLQTYIYDGIWQRPGGRLLWWLQSLVVTQPVLAVLMGISALVFEVGFPVCILLPAAGPLLGLGGIAFHTGIWLVQGLDFTTFWAPALICCCVEGFGGSSGRLLMVELGDGWVESPLAFGAAVTYTVGQLLAAVTFVDISWEEILPWSAFPMFLVPRNVFNKWPRLFTMTEYELRTPGCMESAVHSPITPIYPLSEDELTKLPYRIVQFGSAEEVLPAFTEYFFEKYVGKKFFVFSNFKRSKELEQCLREAIDFMQAAQPADTWDGVKMARLVEHAKICREQFMADCAASNSKDK